MKLFEKARDPYNMFRMQQKFLVKKGPIFVFFWCQISRFFTTLKFAESY